jgi:hypothetical protein
MKPKGVIEKGVSVEESLNKCKFASTFNYK